MSNPIRFLAMNKCGSTSIHDMISRSIGSEFAPIFLTAEDAMKHPRSTREKWKVITIRAPMHTGFDELDSMPAFAVFRNPISRVISFLRMIERGDVPHLTHWSGSSFDIAEILGSYEPELDNLQCKYLLNKRLRSPLEMCQEDAGQLIKSPAHCPMLDEWLEFYCGLDDINQLTEWLEAYLDAPMMKIKRLNADPTSDRIMDQFRPDHLEAITNRNLADLSLWSFIKGR